MSNVKYETQRHSVTSENLKFLFVSNGIETIIKVIDYTYIGKLHNKRVFNLAFGDYNLETEVINDSASSNNNDVYKVFGTVLNSVSDFFLIQPNEIIMVEGSDSKPEFTEKCKLTCSKKCHNSENCKNKDRRINIYRNFINKNFNELIEKYIFYGGSKLETGTIIENYIVNKKYDSIFVIKK